MSSTLRVEIRSRGKVDQESLNPDLADAVGSSLDIMQRDARLMRGDGPVIFSQVKHGPGVSEISELVIGML